MGCEYSLVTNHLIRPLFIQVVWAEVLALGNVVSFIGQRQAGVGASTERGRPVPVRDQCRA